jgi:fermentation-respiration switch protein FrsA (DUF1100 family)
MRGVRLLGLALALPLLFLTLLWLCQRRLIYFPLTPSVARVADVVPRASNVAIVTEDGLELQGWFFPPEREPRAVTVLVFNGNAGSRQDRLPLAAAFARRGLSVLLFDYRGYGGNPGAPSETGLIRDAHAARSWLEARPDVDPGRIVYFGESLGAAVAVALAAERPPSALILRSPFTSLVDTARVHYPWLPVGLMLRDSYDSIGRIPRVDCPLLVIAGEEDSIVPHAQSRRLFEAAQSRAKQFVSMPGADHNDAELTGSEAMVEAAVDFLSGHLGVPAGSG